MRKIGYANTGSFGGLFDPHDPNGSFNASPLLDQNFANTPLGPESADGSASGLHSVPQTAAGAADAVIADPHLSNQLASIDEWWTTFRPFASALVTHDDAGSRGESSPPHLLKSESTSDFDLSAENNDARLSPAVDDNSAKAPDAVVDATDAKADQTNLQKLNALLNALDDRHFDHGPAPETIAHAATPIGNPAPTLVESGSSSDQLLASSSGQASAGGSAATTGGSTTLAGGSASAGLIINVTYDASVNSAPAAFKTDVAAVVSYLESKFTDPITININVGYGEVNGLTMAAGAIGQSMYFLDPFSYAQVKNALAADAKSASDLSSVATLPSSDPTNGGTFYVTSANAKALGLISGSFTDGFVGFSSGVSFDYNNSDGVSPGSYDFYGVVLHEITEVLGRATNDGQNATYYPLDLFHYSAPGVRTFSGTTPGYFSVNNGQTSLNNFNTNPGGDFGDWAGNTIDAANAFGSTGVVSPFSAADLAAMDVIGWNLATSGPVVTASLAVDTGTSSSDNITSNATITGTGNANAVVTVTEGSTTLGTTTANASGAWTFTPVGLANGAHTITASETDSSGNTGTASLTFTLDTTAPIAPSIASFSTDSGTVGDGITNDNTLTLTGTAEANARLRSMTARRCSAAPRRTAREPGAITTAALTNGAHSLTATATDAAGNTGAASAALSVTVDTVAPTAPSITSDVIVNTNSWPLPVRPKPTASSKSMTARRCWAAPPPMAAAPGAIPPRRCASGAHSLTATATDAAGNTGAASSALAVTINTSRRDRDRGDWIDQPGRGWEQFFP